MNRRRRMFAWAMFGHLLALVPVVGGPEESLHDHHDHHGEEDMHEPPPGVLDNILYVSFVSCIGIAAGARYGARTDGLAVGESRRFADDAGRVIVEKQEFAPVRSAPAGTEYDKEDDGDRWDPHDETAKGSLR